MQRLSAARLGDLLAGDLRAFGGPSTIEPLAGRIRAEQVSIVLRSTLLGMAANILNAATFVIAVWGSPDQTKAILWASAIIAAAGFVGLRARSSFQSVKPRSVSRRT
ncbi:GGDEF-domain containing protein, partial [Mesorhizobium sp. M4A.F.Ca.ET.029.04.2.1]